MSAIISIGLLPYSTGRGLLCDAERDLLAVAEFLVLIGVFS